MTKYIVSAQKITSPLYATDLFGHPVEAAAPYINNIPQSVCSILLCDHSSKKNIFWATNDYEPWGSGFAFADQITMDFITSADPFVIMPRAFKTREKQTLRIKKKAEVFTPSWICNAQNNLIDAAWFGRKNIFNTEILLKNDTHSWRTSKSKIIFPKGKTYLDYIHDPRLEIACGEAPYLVSRYDATTGVMIPVKRRIGLLDRKLRIADENTTSQKEFITMAVFSYQSAYGYEWQGDSLLLARVNLLFTFIDFYVKKFGKQPQTKTLEQIAEIISWNIFQMDGLNGVLPCTCTNIQEANLLFPEMKQNNTCPGCAKNNLLEHNGVYAYVMDWQKKEKVRFVDLILANGESK